MLPKCASVEGSGVFLVGLIFYSRNALIDATKDEAMAHVVIDLSLQTGSFSFLSSWTVVVAKRSLPTLAPSTIL